MLGYLVRRILAAIPVMGVVALFVFLLLRLTPGDPAAILAGDNATPERLERIRTSLGLNEPLYVQFFTWINRLLHGDLGVSLIDGRSIADDIGKRLPVTAALAVFGTLLSTVLGIAMGVAAAVRGGVVDRAITVVSGILLSLPAFWVGVLLVFVFSVKGRMLPATGFVPFQNDPASWARSLVLPVLTIALTAAAGIARQTRASMAESLTQEHIRMLRAVGTPTSRIIYVHALRGASLPILASIAIQFIVLFGGSAIIEVLFALPGIGQAMQAAVGNADLPLVQALVLVATLVVVVVNLALELLTLALDPKLRAS